MNPEIVERRQARRYPVELPLKLGEHEGRTRDLSSRGVYFLATVPFEMGEVVEMDVTLSHASTLGPLRLHLRGRIVRVDAFDTVRGLAAEIDDWEVADPELEGLVFDA